MIKSLWKIATSKGWRRWIGRVVHPLHCSWAVGRSGGWTRVPPHFSALILAREQPCSRLPPFPTWRQPAVQLNKATLCISVGVCARESVCLLAASTTWRITVISAPTPYSPRCIFILPQTRRTWLCRGSNDIIATRNNKQVQPATSFSGRWSAPGREHKNMEKNALSLLQQNISSFPTFKQGGNCADQ